MADLATNEELALALGLSESEADTAEDLLTLLLDGAEAFFETECNRADLPFQDAETGREETHDGVRSRKLWLDYPIADVTEIVIGRDLSDPDVELDPDDAEEVQWQAGSRRLLRTDCGDWRSGEISFVKVTYDTQDDLPEDAKHAVLGLAKQLYQDSGTEGIQSETLDNYSVTFARATQAAQRVPGWQLAVNRHRRYGVG